MHAAHELAGFIQCRDDALRSVSVLWKLPRKVIRSNCDGIKPTTLTANCLQPTVYSFVVLFHNQQCFVLFCKKSIRHAPSDEAN